jgi:NADPH-dependent glutamate synthase beta subunit-like oxidoreductase/Pyruvate/2-oxoacid:ferredoxin oxidoreductase delta subunit
MSAVTTPSTTSAAAAGISAGATGASGALVPPTWTTGTTEVFKTGTWRAALPRHVHAPSPCHGACPVNGDIAEWIGHARAGDIRRAFDVLARHNPFPAIAGRVCHHPCESACNRAAVDAAVSICRLERFVGDRAIAEGWPLPRVTHERAGRVAVVGGGPAGLSAAYQLRRRGWQVTLFEADAQLGGLLRHGIPAYRLARDVLDAEIARIVALGVDVQCNAPLVNEAQWRVLRSGHDAVFVATGAAQVRRLPGLTYDGVRVLDGAAWLRTANAGIPSTLGRRVVVVGGGSAALDAARSAQRAGHEVTVLALEARAQMPAQREEIEEALEEGIGLVDGAMLVRAEDAAAHDGSGAPALRLHCQHVRFEPGAERGRFRIEPIAGSEFEWVADALLTSIGQDAYLAPFGGTLAHAGTVLATEAAESAGCGRTGAQGVWAGGDVASLARFVTSAVGMGQRAAEDIHASLLARGLGGAAHTGDAADGSDCSNGLDAAAPFTFATTVDAQAIATAYHVPTPRAADNRLPPAARHATAEVQLALDASAAAAEAARCFSCGTCIDCDNCVVVCPDLAVRRAAAGGYEVLGDYCKGCGLCVRECPTGSMTMVEEKR